MCTTLTIRGTFFVLIKVLIKCSSGGWITLSGPISTLASWTGFSKDGPKDWSTDRHTLVITFENNRGVVNVVGFDGRTEVP
jgi:hypothetical protein